MFGINFSHVTGEQKIFTVLALVAFIASFAVLVLPFFVPELSVMEKSADMDVYKKPIAAMALSLGALFVTFKL